MKRIALTLALLSASCAAQPQGPAQETHVATSRPPPPVQEEGRRRPTAIEHTAIARIITATEEVRGLEFKMPVRVDIESAARIAASLSDQITEEDVQKATHVYQALGLLPAEVDVRELLEGVLGEQVVGYYDTDSARLVVRDDVIRILVSRPNTREAALARLTLLHELVHALQDQWLHLGEIYEAEHDSDDEGVVRSIAEGDAMLTMVLHDAAARGQDLRQAALERGRRPVDLNGLNGDPSGELSNAPAILRVTLVAPYLLGLRVVARAYYEGGWDAVNALFTTPPDSMEAVMHPVEAAVATEVTMPEFPSMHEAGFELLDEDTLGELELGVYLAQNRAEDVDTESAQGWHGDRIRIYQRDSAIAVVWWIAFDSEEDATRAATAAEQAGSDVARTGRALFVTRHVVPELRASLLAPFETFALAL